MLSYEDRSVEGSNAEMTGAAYSDRSRNWRRELLVFDSSFILEGAAGNPLGLGGGECGHIPTWTIS
jgi:hypothetical protein